VELKGFPSIFGLNLAVLLFTPRQNPARLVGLLPLVYAVRWKRNIYVSVIIHGVGTPLR
jgi:hypothetical protein